jgi:hypothetical protein
MQHRSCFAIPLGELKLKFTYGGKIKKSFNHPRSLYSIRPIQPKHFQADLIWCDSTFNGGTRKNKKENNNFKKKFSFYVKFYNLWLIFGWLSKYWRTGSGTGSRYGTGSGLTFHGHFFDNFFTTRKFPARKKSIIGSRSKHGSKHLR